MNDILENALSRESRRQEENIELIASENFVSDAVLQLQGSILTNKYAEGYPNRRYYGGCEYIDIFETEAIELAKKLFKCNYANVQAHCGSSANMAAYRALLEPKDKVLGMNLSHGGHLTHGHSVNFSGSDYEFIGYNVNNDTHLIDYEELEKLALKEKPKLIVAGASAYPRMIDFKKFREIADKCGSYLMVDMAHIAGLVAADLHMSPIPYADVVTSTTHKTLRGPRGGLILTNNEEIAKKIDKIIFPGIQGGPLMHVIGAKAQCFYEALNPNFKKYQEQVIKNAKQLEKTLKEQNVKIVSDGTDNHLLLIDIKSSFNITGKDAEIILDTINITANKNTIPYDEESPVKTSGLRIGTPAMTTRGLKEKDFEKIAIIIVKALSCNEDKNVLEELKKEVLELTKKFPMNKRINK